MHRARSIALISLLALVASGCDVAGGLATGSPGASVAPGSPPPETDRPIESESLAPNLPGQSETEWGPIWDAVPQSYPVPDGAEPAEADQGPVSGAYTVATSVATPKTLASFYAVALEDGGFGGTGIDGPLEDDSYSVWSSSGYGCDTLVTILPRGEESLITILFGALCRFE
jgi:hypothetical protein